MSTINKKLVGFIFSGSALNLSAAPFKGNINSITGFNAAGTSYVSYRPTSTFNSLTQLVQDGSYIVDAKTTGFDIPGAVLTAANTPGPGPGPGKMEFYSLEVDNSGSSTYVSFAVVHSDSTFGAHMAYVDDKVDNITIASTSGGGELYFSPKLTDGTHTIHIVDTKGNILSKDFTV